MTHPLSGRQALSDLIGVAAALHALGPTAEVHHYELLAAAIDRAKGVLEATRCRAQPTGDPPIDCDAPFCGCDPAWQDALEKARESGWLTDREAEELRAQARGALNMLKLVSAKFDAQSLRADALEGELSVWKGRGEHCEAEVDRLRRALEKIMSFSPSRYIAEVAQAALNDA